MITGVPCYEEHSPCVHGDDQIFYRVDGKQVLVMRVLHGARDYEAVL